MAAFEMARFVISSVNAAAGMETLIERTAPRPGYAE